MNPTESLKDQQSSILNEVIQTRHQKEIIHQHLRNRIAW